MTTPSLGLEALAMWATIKALLLTQAREEGQTTEVTSAIAIIESALGITSQPT
jgi:hypothetical protein